MNWIKLGLFIIFCFLHSAFYAVLFIVLHKDLAIISILTITHLSLYLVLLLNRIDKKESNSYKLEVKGL